MPASSITSANFNAGVYCLSRDGSNHDRPDFLQPGSLGNDFLIKIGGKDSSNVIRIKFWHD